MIAHFGIEQKSTDWFAVKWGKVGGTRAKELFVKSDTLLFKLMSETLEDFDEDQDEGYQSEAMERGNDLESEARIQLEKYSGFTFLNCGWIESEESKLLGISPDGITADFKVQCEIKCPQSIAHIKMCIADEIPLEYINQCIHAFTVNDKLETLYFCSYRPELEIKPLFVKVLNRESLVNNGTNAKPVIDSISNLCKLAVLEAKKLEQQIEINTNKLKF